jgi:LacI family transcriptional regulator
MAIYARVMTALPTNTPVLLFHDFSAIQHQTADRRVALTPGRQIVSVTLSDVAQQAGVSIKTVSRVVNNQAEVRAETRARVLEAIAQLGYHPNALARSLVQQRSRALGLVSFGLDRNGPSRFVMGVQREAAELGYSVLLTLLRGTTAQQAEAILNDLVSRRVDGIIWQAPNIGDTQRWICPERLKTLPPIVLNGLPSPYLTTVSIDNHHGAFLAVQHLIDQGWRRIGFLSGLPDFPMTTERRRGWRDCLAQNGFDPEPSLIEHADWTAQGGATAMAALLARRPDVDAVFAYNDAMALGALYAAKQAGRRVGHDLGVIGFDDAADAAFYDPPLSSVHQRIANLGREAVRALVRLVEMQAEGKPLPPPVLILSRPELVIRESSLRAKSAGG